MKVILLQELKGRGGEGDVIEVARGFAVNYLLPRKFAIEATKGNLKQLEQRSHNIQKREDQRLGDAEGLGAKLNGKVITIEAKVGDEGRLFGSVTHAHIEAALLEQLGVEVDRRKIETHGAIKDAGPRVIEVSIYRDIKAELTVNVVAEGAAAAAPAAAVTETVTETADEGEAFVDTLEAAIEGDVAEAEPEVAAEDEDATEAEPVADVEEAEEAAE